MDGTEATAQVDVPGTVLDLTLGAPPRPRKKKAG
jgi:hypothetical protein